MSKELFLVWKDDPNEQFYNQYDSLEDAVCDEGENGDAVEVFHVVPKSLGIFRKSYKIVKAKKSE